MTEIKKSVLVEFPDLTRRWRKLQVRQIDICSIRYKNQRYFVVEAENGLYKLREKDHPLFYLHNLKAFKPT